MKHILLLLFSVFLFLSTFSQKDTNQVVFTIKSDNIGGSNDSAYFLMASSLSVYDLDWDGDGIFDTLGLTGSLLIQYDSIGIYTLRIRGYFPALLLGQTILFSSNDCRKVVSFDQWGSQVWLLLDFAFKNCNNLIYNATDSPNLSNVNSLQGMFSGVSLFNYNINNWDVSNIQSFAEMFYDASLFNQPLDNWDVSSAQHMNYMFYNATSFNHPLNKWDLSAVTNMSFMLSNAQSFNQPINNWDVSNVLDFTAMFQNATSFNQPLNNWDVSAAQNMLFMFYNANSFNQPLNSWDVSGVLYMSHMFCEAKLFNQQLNNWDVSNVQNFSAMFCGDSLFNQPLNNWDVSSALNLSAMFNNAISFNQPLNNWDLSSCKDLSLAFAGASSFQQDISNWDVSNNETLYGTFASCPNFSSNLNSWNTLRVTDMQYTFYNCKQFNQNLSNWNIDSVISMTGILDSTAMNTSNYDSTLITWQTKSHLLNVPFGAAGLEFCSSDSARSLLIANGWVFSGDNMNCLTTEIEKLSSNSIEFDIFPNPTSGIIKLNVVNDQNERFQVYSNIGQLIFDGILESKGEENDLSYLGNGIYFIKIGNQSQKLIIQK